MDRSKRVWLKIKILATVQKDEFLKFDLALMELHNDYPLAPDKIEIIREMLSYYQLKIADLYNILISNVKNLVPNIFDKEKYDSLWKLTIYLRLGLKLKIYLVY